MDQRQVRRQRGGNILEKCAKINAVLMFWGVIFCVCGFTLAKTDGFYLVANR